MSRRTSGSLSALSSMITQAPSLNFDRLALTEAALASADSLWRAEMKQAYGPDAVLAYGYTPEGQGGLGTPLRRSYEARRVAVALWRRERHRAA